MTIDEEVNMVEKELQGLNDSVMNVRLDIRELMTEVRSLKDLQTTVNQHEVRLTRTEEALIALSKQVAKIDKIFWFLATTVTGSLILAFMSFITIKR